MIINVVVVLVSPPKMSLRMPVRTEKHVELICAVSIEGFLTSLSYNVMLVIVCSYYAFKTRMLPDNFNESRYISFCVYTTLVIWLAFVPSYFTTSKSYSQAIFLACALILNASVALLCLFAPKIYAVCKGSDAIALHQRAKNGCLGHGFVVGGNLNEGGTASPDPNAREEVSTECQATASGNGDLVSATLSCTTDTSGL